MLLKYSLIYLIAKSPIGMFDDLYIENDLKAVDNKIREFYGINNKEEK